MVNPEPNQVPLSHLPPAEKAERAGSFGGAATQYERYRPGPPTAAVDWLVPRPVGRIVDLGAGTGALTRLLIERADEVIAVEPDDRMRNVLVDEVPDCRAVSGRGDAMPVPDASVDAVLASSSWHWMDTLPTLHEVGRVLVPGGTLGAVWSGPDPEGDFIVQARTLLSQQAGGSGTGSGGNPAESPGANLATIIMPDALRPTPELDIPVGVPFDQPDRETFLWDVPLTADDLVGLLGTFSWVITMPEETRQQVIDLSRRLLKDLLGVEGDVTIEVGFRCDAWRSRRHS